MKKDDHIPLQHHIHTYPNNTNINQAVSSHGHFSYDGYYSAHPKKVSSHAPLILCLVDISTKGGRKGISITVTSLRSTFLLLFSL